MEFRKPKPTPLSKMRPNLPIDLRLPLAILLSCLLAAGMKSTAMASSKDEDGKPKMVDLWSPGDHGQRMRIRGRVTSIDGSPVPNVQIYFRHADSRGLVTANDKGVYQFGSVIPGNSHRLSHVHVYVDHPGYEYLETEFYFKQDPKADEAHPNAIFLEEGTLDGETMMYGRFDITLMPF